MAGFGAPVVLGVHRKAEEGTTRLLDSRLHVGCNTLTCAVQASWCARPHALALSCRCLEAIVAGGSTATCTQAIVFGLGAIFVCRLHHHHLVQACDSVHVTLRQHCSDGDQCGSDSSCHYSHEQSSCHCH